MHLSDETACERFTEAARNLPRAPESEGAGRGIVICAGGQKYFTCAWVCVNMLRHLGCDLPIEMWHLGSVEINASMAALVGPLGVTCVDALEVRKAHPVRTLNGYELKPFSILHSRFREVLFLDADNVPIVDPTFLLNTPEYRAAGAIFWPDFGRLQPDRSIWRLTGTAYRDEPEFESGQMVIDRVRCFRELNLTMWMNEYSDYWYKHVHGDKETFHLAWRHLEAEYAMPTRGIDALPGTMCQHDFAGRRIFQHRNLCKWAITHNRRVPDFQFEETCLQYLKELRPHSRVIRGFPPFVCVASALIGDTIANYERVGYDQRTLVFEASGEIGSGADRMERFWNAREEGPALILEIYGDDGLTARLIRSRTDPLVWAGRWLIHERMTINLTFHAPEAVNTTSTDTEAMTC